MKRLLFFAIIIVAVTTNSLSASDKEKVAVLAFEPLNCSKMIAGVASDMIGAKIFEQRIFTLIERDQIEMVFKELELQQTGCTDAACAVKIGKLLSANKIVQGKIYKIDTYFIVVKIVNVGDNKIVGNYKAEAADEDDIENAVSEIIEKLKTDFSTDIFFSASISAGYRSPMGDFSKISKGGYGVTLNLDLNNFIFQGGVLNLSNGFSFYTGKEESIESIMSISELLHYGYTLNVSRSFKLTPYIGGGYLINIMSYDEDNADQFGEYEYTKKTYYDPAASAKIDINYVVTPFLHFIISPQYVYFFEKDKAGQILFADIGIKFMF